jgi:hypothetical protein
MTTRVKKIIATEVIIFTIYLFVTSGICLVIWLHTHNKLILKTDLKSTLDNLNGRESIMEANWLLNNSYNPIDEDGLPSLYEFERMGFYNEITKKYDIGTFSEFSKKIRVPDRRQLLYNRLTSDGYNFGSFVQFEKKLGFDPTKSSKYITQKIYLNKWINIYSKYISAMSVYGEAELNSLLLRLILAFSIIFYPIRILGITLIWAFKTLRAK